MFFEGKCFKFFNEFFYGVFKVGLNTQQNSPTTHYSAIQNSITKLNLNSAGIALNKPVPVFFFRVLSGTEIFIFHHALNSGTSVLHVNCMKNMFLSAQICPFTNSQICKRTNNWPIDKKFVVLSISWT